ncbi:hypothetical protein NMN56_030720, partial [Streptomyces iconiensis]|nr:hypothetical protein [Streptomyces iconiensis]
CPHRQGVAANEHPDLTGMQPILSACSTPKTRPRHWHLECLSTPDPTPLLPTGVEEASYAGADATPAVPANVRPLRDALTAAGIVVEWNLAAADWFRLEAIVKRTAVAALVDHARGQWQHARSRPRSVRYFLPGWTALPPVPEGAPTAPGANVIPLAGPRRGRVAAAADMFAAALATTPEESAQ